MCLRWLRLGSLQLGCIWVGYNTFGRIKDFGYSRLSYFMLGSVRLCYVTLRYVTLGGNFIQRILGHPAFMEAAVRISWK